MLISAIKANIPLGKEITALRSGSYRGILDCRHIGGRLLVAGIAAGPVAWERCLRADRKKRGGTCHVCAQLLMSRCHASVCITPRLRKYSHQLISNSVWPCFERVRVFLIRSGNNMNGQVYCLRAQNRGAFASRWSSIVLPYLGPEIITVIKTESSLAPSDSWSDLRPTFPRSDGKITSSIVLSSTLSYSNSRTARVLNVWVNWALDAHTPPHRI